MKKSRPIFSILVAIMLAISGVGGVFNFTPINAYAEDSGTTAILFGAEKISAGMIDVNGNSDDSHIWFGNKATMTKPESYYSTQWMDEGTPYWRVLDGDGSLNGTENSILVMSEYLWRTTGPSGGYGYVPSEDGYQGSRIQTQLTRMYTTGLFSETEKTVMSGNAKHEDEYSSFGISWKSDDLLTDDTIFILSAAEIQKYILLKTSPTVDWKTTNTDTSLIAYRGSTGTTNIATAKSSVGDTAYWWIRSITSSGYPCWINSSGNVTYNSLNSLNGSFSLRPAFNIDLNSVVFASEPEGGKDCGLTGSYSLKEVKNSTSNDWKLTVFDADNHGDFSISSVSKNTSRNTITFVYSGAATGTNEYLSAVIVDSNGDVKYYGKILDLSEGEETGTAMIDISSCDTSGSDTLYVLNEKCNGDYLTDFSSDVKYACTLFSHDVIHSHLLSKTDAVAPTCVKDGNIDYWTCTLCDKMFRDEEGVSECNGDDIVDPATGHSLVKTDETPATCTEGGNIAYWQCSTCGTYFGDENGIDILNKNQLATNAIGHSWGKWEYMDAELHSRSCLNNSDHVETGEHNWTTYYMTDKEATCTEEGSESIHCSICLVSKEGTEQTIPITDHNYGEWEITKEATCTENGSRVKTCKDCGDEVTEVIPATGHSWNEDYTVDKEATCTEEGQQSIHCSVCDAIQEGSESTIDKLPHNYGEWEITKEATCTENGSRVKTCKNCGDEVTEVIPATGHAWNTDYTIDKEATCTEEGSKSIHCANCDETKDDEGIPATGHSFGEWTTVKSSTCEDSGLQQRVCEVCGFTETKDLDPNGHVWGEEYTVDQAATCTEDGSESIHCQNCDAVKDSRTIPASGHSYGEWVVKKAVTCTEDGLKEQTCQNCGDVVSQVIPATGHSWESVATVDKAATCTEDGSQSIHCANCDETKDTESIPAVGHEWGEPTYTWSKDNKSVTASRVCVHDSSHVEKETVKTAAKVSKAATYTAKGQTTYTATFSNEAFASQTKTATDIAKLAQKANTLTAKGKTVTVKYAKVKKKAQTITVKKAFTVSKAQGKVTYKKASGNKKITVSSAGKITVKKGLKKGTYKIKVKVTAAGTTAYKAATKTVTVTVKVK